MRSGHADRRGLPDLSFPIDRLTVEAWPDPVIDQLGHDPRSAYVERFWLGVLGPSTVWLLRRLADQFDQQPDGFELDLPETARALGVGMRGGRHSPFMRSVERVCRFGAGRWQSPTELAVRRKLPPADPGPARTPVAHPPGRARRLDRRPGATRPDRHRRRRRSCASGPASWPCRCWSWVRTRPPPSASCTAGGSTRPWRTRRCAGPSRPTPRGDHRLRSPGLSGGTGGGTTRASSTSRRTPHPVPPLVISRSSLSLQAVPAMSRWTHGMPSPTNSRRNSPAMIEPACVGPADVAQVGHLGVEVASGSRRSGAASRCAPPPAGRPRPPGCTSRRGCRTARPPTCPAPPRWRRSGWPGRRWRRVRPRWPRTGRRPAPGGPRRRC